MRYHKTCVILFGVILNASQTYGVLEINLPPNKIGYYKETTLLNCTDTPFIVANGYSWSKGTAVIYNSVTGDATGTGKYASSHGTDYFTLEIKDTKLDDKGDYKCSYNFNEADDALEIHAKGSGQGKVEGDKLVITLTEFYPNTTTVSSVICNGKTFTGTSEVTDAGELFNLVWTSDASVDTSDLKKNCEVSMSSISPYVIVFAVDIATTTTTSTISTTAYTTTTTTKSTTTTTTTPTTTTGTTPKTTTITTPTTTTTKPTTSITTAATPPATITSSTKSSNGGLSDEMIIVLVFVPVGVIAIVGTVIFFCLFYRLRMGKRQPAGHERHKHGRHYKGNSRPVQQHQQQPYILYGRSHTRQSNHRETKRSRSLHIDDRYNWYDRYHWGNQVKQNPVFKGDRNLGRLYNNGSLPRNDDYWSGYTTGHAYPSHTSGYHYRPDYHGDSKGHGNRQYSSYPVYSPQQEYINPSYSYMGYLYDNRYQHLEF